MGSDFEIFFKKDQDQLFVNLCGDFDDASAHELVTLLQKNHDEIGIAFIRTDNVGNIDPSGIKKLEEEVLLLDDFCYRLVFTGKNANKLEPGYLRCF